MCWNIFEQKVMSQLFVKKYIRTYNFPNVDSDRMILWKNSIGALLQVTNLVQAPITTSDVSLI